MIFSWRKKNLVPRANSFCSSLGINNLFEFTLFLFETAGKSPGWRRWGRRNYPGLPAKELSKISGCITFVLIIVSVFREGLNHSTFCIIIVFTYIFLWHLIYWRIVFICPNFKQMSYLSKDDLAFFCLLLPVIYL